MLKNIIDLNIKYNTLKGINTWRKLYLKFIFSLNIDSVIEFGSGDPDFLFEVSKFVKYVCGIDANYKLEEMYKEKGIDFYCIDLNSAEKLDVDKKFDIAICSDVFEHILYPTKTLNLIKSVLNNDGYLFSHVPNEYRFFRTMKIMLGKSETVYWHKCEEWENPHLRSFSDIGYRKFLKTTFKYNLKIDDMNYKRFLHTLNYIGVKIPYCFMTGPTYISTDSRKSYNTVSVMRKKLL